MSIELICPVCDTQFEASQHALDSCGDTQSNATFTEDCPDCGFMVIAEYAYDEMWSERCMVDANTEKYEQRTVAYTAYKAVWTKKDAPVLEGEVIDE